MSPESQQSMTPALTSGGAPLNVTVTGAAGNIAYAILFMIGSGQMAGPNQKINLCLLDIPAAAGAIEGVAMEIRDCAFPCVANIVCTTEYKVAFTGCDVALLIGAKPRGPGMVRADLLRENGAIFKGQGEALNQYASSTCKILVVGNPANTNALIAMTYAPNIPRKNFTAMTRLDQNRANNQLATKLGADVTGVNKVAIWGNHSKTMFADIAHFQTLFTSDWPATVISDAASVDGNTGSTWNYGSNFGGPTKATWTSGKDTVHSGMAEGMFGSFGVVDSAYSGTSTVGSIIGLCPGTAGSICRG